MKVLIIIGSHKKQSNSAKVAEWIVNQLQIQDPTNQYDTLDLGKVRLPLWDEDIWQNDPKWVDLLQPIQQQAANADAIIAVVPEYSGMAAPAFKNAMLFFGSEHLGHKPGLLVSVSSSKGGTYPVAELRMSGTKNNRLVWLPDHVIVRFADSFATATDNASDHEAQERLAYSLLLLESYAQAFKKVRQNPIIAASKFIFGM